MKQDDLGVTTAYGAAVHGGYTGKWQQWYDLFLSIIHGEINIDYDAMEDKPSINGVVISGDHTLNYYKVYEIGGSTLRATGNVGEKVTVNGVEVGEIGNDGKAQIDGIIDIGTWTVEVGSKTVEIEVPYYGIYKA